MRIRKIIFTIIAAVLAMAVNVSGQNLEFKIQDLEVPTGVSTIEVPVVVKNFVKVTVFQYELSYDSTVLKIDSVSGINSNIDGLNKGSFGIATEDRIEEGRITVSFNNGADAQTLPDDAIAFKLNFKVIRKSTTEISFNEEKKKFWSDETYARLDLVTVNSKITFEGGGNGGNTGTDDLTCTAGNENARPGERVCVPVTVANFKAVRDGASLGTFEGRVKWDTSVLKYDKTENVALPDEFQFNESEPGNLKLSWYIAFPDEEFTGLSDGEKLMDLCFDVVGDDGSSTDINLTDWEWGDELPGGGASIPSVTNSGSVTVTSTPLEKVTFTPSIATVVKGGTGCVEFKVTNFTDIGTLEFAVGWDANVVSLKDLKDEGGLKDINLPKLTPGNFNITSTGKIGLTWASGSGAVTLEDNKSMFSLCFEALADCGESSSIQLLEQNGNFIVGKLDTKSNPIRLPASQIERGTGKITVECAKECSISSITNACGGSSSGAINVDVESGGTCEWRDANGNLVSTDCNLAGVAAGTYDLTVSYSSGKSCTLSGTIEDKPGPRVSGQVTNATCSTKGAIEVMISNTSGSPTYSWSNGLPQSLTQNNLDPGTYTITVDDGSDCTTSIDFVVKASDQELTVAFTKSDVLCFGEKTGSIKLNVSGGCPGYKYVWNNASSDGDELKNIGAGTYNVTVTDASNIQKVATIEIAGPAKDITLDKQDVKNTDDGANGSIALTVSGGAGVYTYAWSGGLPSSSTVTGLSKGSYTVTVTDDSGCSKQFGPFVVVQNGDNTELTITAKDFGNGAGVPCFGEKAGELSITISGKSFPGTLIVKGDDYSENQNVSTSGTVVLKDLAAGVYEVLFKDNANTEVKKTFEIRAPEEFKFNLGPNDVKCENENDEDGSINVVTSGGTGNLLYQWNDPDLSGDRAKNLSKGSYTVIVTDENQCSIMQTFIISDCNGTPDGCYKFPEVLTPNNDGVNDFFTASCLADYPTKLYIFDRWGQKVYEATDYDGSWTGVDTEGNELRESAYMYVFEVSFLQGKKEIVTGTVTILRD